MPIEPMSFPLLSFEQSNPGLMRLKANLGNLLNGMQGISDYNYKQAQVPYLQSESALNQQKTNWYGRDTASQIAERNASAQKSLADAALTNKDVPFEDRLNQAKINYQNTMANFRNMGGSGGSTGGKDQMLLQSLVGKDNPGLSPDEVYEATNVLMNGGNSLSSGKKLNSLSPLARETFNRVVKSGTTSQGLNQQRGGALATDIMERGDKLIGDVSDFAGISGKGKLTADQVAASLGDQNPKYLSYLNFTRQIVPELANQMIKLEGVNANNTQKNLMLKVADPTYWDSNPSLALKQWKYLTDTFKGYNKTISSGSSDIKQRLSQGISNESKTQENKENGSLDFSKMSDEQLRKLAGL